jgi:hypothetical protein
VEGLVRVVLIKGPSMYEGTRTFIDHAAAAFESRGHVADVIDLQGLSDPLAELLAAAARAPADLVFSVNILGEARDNEGRSMRTMFGAPHVVWHVDYVLSQEARLAGTPGDTALLVVDPTQIEAVHALYGPARWTTVEFCPHAAIGEAAPDDADPEAFAAARPIGILWSGTLQKPATRPWANAAGATRRMFDDAFDLALSCEWMPPHQAMDAALAARGLHLDEPANLGARVLAKWIDVEVRKTRRFEFVKAVAKTGLPIHICGEGWDDDLDRFKRATYEGPAPMLRVAELMRQSRIVLNTNGNFGAGSHERPLSALLAGAAAFSDRTDFYAEALGEDVGIALFRWKDLTGGMHRLQQLHSDPTDAWRIATTGKPKVIAGHTFDARVDLILAAAGLA